MMPPRDFDVGVARRLAELEKITERHDSLILNPGLSDGTFTPTFLGTTIAGVFTYTLQQGFYWRMGNKIDLLGRILISAIPTPPTGNMRIGGLPFTSDATYTGGVNFNRISNFNYTAGAMDLTAIINAGGTVASLYESFDNAGVVAAPAANFTNVACEFFFSGVYLAA